MLKLISFFVLVIISHVSLVQQLPTDLDKSPLDVSYFPANYPILKMRGQAKTEPFARILYSRPQKKGRDIFGGEVAYNEVWRFGANEATEIELFKNAIIGGKKIGKGRYTLYCIPSEKSWTIIVNKDNYSWGGFTYSSTKDIARVEVPTKKTDSATEALTIYFTPSSFQIMWDTTMVDVPISFL